MKSDRQSPSPPPSPAEPASSDGSAKASSPGSTTSGFIAEPGPAFDPKSAPEGPPPRVEPALLPEWEEDTVRSILTAQGAVVHTLAGHGDTDWVYLEEELDAIAPPLTRILNRYDATRAAAGTGDEIALVIGLGGYTVRSYLERKAALEAAAGAEPEPITGIPADGPADDPAQQAARGEMPTWETETR